jgi:hypothetical protein
MPNELRIMDATGDMKIIFDPRKPDEVEAARATFNTLKAKGYLAFRVDDAGEKTAAMDKFDPKAGKVILSPPVVGG